MKYKLHAFLLASVMALSGFVGTSFATDTKTVYTMSDNGNFGKGIYTFELGDTINDIKLLQPMTYDGVSGGLLVDDTYYYLEYSQVYNGYKVLGLYSYDMENKTVKQIVDYGGAQNGTISSCFSYDYQTGTMYGLDFFNGGSSLQKIDLETGTIATVGKLTYDVLCDAAKTASVGEHMHVMTSTYDGDLYGVSYWGALYKINQYTAQCQYIGTLDYNPGQAFMYTGDCLFYDNDTDRLYLRFTTYNWDTQEWLYEVVKIDTKTAHVTQFAKVPAQSSLNAISVPFTVASASAPAKVQNLAMKVGEAGALTTTLEWDNPSKTYGRGGTLEDLDYVLVYRDGELKDSIINPTIGAHQTWTDTDISERGYYTYKIVAGNDVGHGDRASIGNYVGKGDPLGVTEVKLERDGDGARLVWTAPTEGKLGAYIDVNTLNYDIVRYGNSSTVGTKIASGLKANVYADSSLTDMGKYTYGIVAHTDNAQSDTIKTEARILGPAYATPHTFAFDSQDEFNLWTTIDANGNYFTWEWSQGYYGTMKGATCDYKYDGVIAADWLISPRVKLEAGKRYKVTFDALPGSRKVMETLAVSFGQGVEIADQDSINQFEIVSDSTVHLRANLPVVKTTDDYNFGFLYRSNVVNYKLAIGNIQVSEDHEGYIAGGVTCDGKPVAGATVIVEGGKYKTVTDEEGNYTLSYLPEGKHTVTVMAFGYEDATQAAEVTEYETSDCIVSLKKLPAYTVTGVVKDVAGDPVANATVGLSGYENRDVVTDGSGKFSMTNVYKNGNYAVKVSKNKLLEASKSFGVEADTDLGIITLEDNHKPAGRLALTDNKTSATVEWKAPANDAVLQRIDDGTMTTSVGIANATSNTMFGVVKREPGSVSGVQFFIDGTASVTHYSVKLNIFNLDENGNPTDSLLYQNTYVPATDGKWNSYTLPAPVDAPNGYYMALSYDGYLLVGIDGAGDSERYPFVEGVNCFTPDYTTGQYLYLEGQSNGAYHHNFLVRPIAAPFTVAEDSTEFKAKKYDFVYNVSQNTPSVELESKTYDEPLSMEPAVTKTPQSRIRYNVYRMKSSDLGDESKWTLLSEKQQARSYEDATWGGLQQGVYAYAVKAVYTGDIPADASVSDTIGNKMLTTVTYKVSTNTPDNESYGAVVTMVSGGGKHVSKGTVDDGGNVTLANVWKGEYSVSVVLDGFKTYTTTVDVSKDDAYSFSCNLDENRIKPYNLVIDEGNSPTEKKFIWNYPDLFFEDFEGHENFAINSPGSIGWQYLDGDGAETGAMRNYTWEGQGKPMAYMVFNTKATTPASDADLSILNAYSGDKCLTDWAAYLLQNDDWIITPKLHFAKDFKFSFYASSSDSYYLESFEVAYSTTDTRPESFVTVQDSTTAPAYWQQFSYDIPKEAKYVAIRSISDQMRVFKIDDIRFGLSEAMSAPAAISRYAVRAGGGHRSPSLDGLYEVYLDGEKVAQQDETEYVFSNLAAGRHTAGVIASYTSGKTEMSTIGFEVDLSGIVTGIHEDLNISLDNQTLTISGDYDDLHIFSVDGKACRPVKVNSGEYDMSGFGSGVYIINVTVDGRTETFKVRL